MMPGRAVKPGPDAVRPFTALSAAERSRNKRFWKIIDDAVGRGEKEGYVDLADL
jgi:hypothetical protein